ncbi:FAD binding domain-containing protein [Nocardia sp. NPDC004168]|uniref:FAD binding domain-containing protein n=1 Tax=Nocardia sp. NPDC004168 TaxID=3154452 RepID=UPI0033AC54A3
MTLYEYPSTLSSALTILSEHPDALLLGGGTMIMPKLATGELRPEVILDVSRIPELTRVVLGAEGDWTLGAAVTYQTVLSTPGLPLLLRTAATGVTGGPQILAQGTIGGSASYANPASDMPSILVALNAKLIVDGVHGRQEIAAGEFFESAFVTAITQRPMMLCQIRIPADRINLPSSYVKLKVAESSWPVVTAATTIINPAAPEWSRQCRVTVGGSSETPFSIVFSTNVNLSTLREFFEQSALSWIDDTLASAAYRKRVTPVVVERSIRKALERMESVEQI